MSVENPQDRKTGIIVAAGILAVIVACLFMFSHESAAPLAHDIAMSVELDGNDTLDTKAAHNPGKRTGSQEQLSVSVPRKRLSEPDTKAITPGTPCTVTFRVTIDIAGNVTDAEVVPGKTTTNDQRVINKAAAAVKKDVRYEPGQSATEKVILSVNIR